MTSIILSVIAVIAVLIAVALVVMYNSLVASRNKVNEAFSTMDVYLKKRFDLIPNLVEVVKGYATHESDTLQNVTGMRTGATTPGQKLSVEDNITKALGSVMVAVEKYPELKANTSFLDLQKQLRQIEDDIASARRYYNGSVREMNNKVQTFPNNMFAGMFGFRPMPMFEASDQERRNVSTEMQ